MNIFTGNFSNAHQNKSYQKSLFICRACILNVFSYSTQHILSDCDWDRMFSSLL